MACTYLSHLTVLLQNMGPTILLSFTVHQTDQGFVGYMWILWTPVAIILRIYVSLQVKPRFVTKECQMRADLTFDDRV
jgi:hypothetical protein